MEIFIKNFSKNLADAIILKINKLANKNNFLIDMQIFHTKKYWKEPELTICYLYVYSKQNLSFNDFIKIFNIKFPHYNFSIDCLTKNDIKCSYPYEEVIWSKHMSKNTFLDKNIEWIKIWTNWCDINQEYAEIVD